MAPEDANVIKPIITHNLRNFGEKVTEKLLQAFTSFLNENMDISKIESINVLNLDNDDDLESFLELSDSTEEILKSYVDNLEVHAKIEFLEAVVKRAGQQVCLKIRKFYEQFPGLDRKVVDGMQPQKLPSLQVREQTESDLLVVFDKIKNMIQGQRSIQAMSDYLTDICSLPNHEFMTAF